MKKLIEYIYELLGYYKAHDLKGSSNRTTKNYRKIWSDAYGPIPVDKNGRTFDIHHIDGDSHNCDLSNLIAVSRAHHIQIHDWQGDNGAVALLEGRVRRRWFGTYKRGISKPREVKTVVQFDLNGNKVRTFGSLKEAYQGKEGGPIRACLNGHQKSAGGYQWKYELEVMGLDNINPVKRNEARVVGNNTERTPYVNLNTMDIFKSLRAASRNDGVECYYKGHIPTYLLKISKVDYDIMKDMSIEERKIYINI